MNVRELEKQLRKEGFTHAWVWQDGPGAYYPDHAHEVATAHVVLEGDMMLICGGSSGTYRAGECAPDVPAGAVHSAKMGPRGCRYLIGEKRS